eukprot:10810923-Prorocentrum_lima.AAC.1
MLVRYVVFTVCETHMLSKPILAKLGGRQHHHFASFVHGVPDAGGMVSFVDRSIPLSGIEFTPLVDGRLHRL